MSNNHLRASYSNVPTEIFIRNFVNENNIDFLKFGEAASSGIFSTYARKLIPVILIFVNFFGFLVITRHHAVGF